MKRGRSTGKPTAAQLARWDAIRDAGCVACAMYGTYTYPEIHHMTVGGKHGQKRLGHDFTFGLCPYHHRGVPVAGVQGTSFALNPRAFRETFGEQDALLAFQDELLKAREAA